jgi:hypothetical protein
LGVADCVWPTVLQPTERQRVADEIEVALVFARAEFVKVDILGYVAS